MLIPVILSGGVGSRLWPVSRELHPKPFIKLADGQSLLQKTFLRACNLPDVQTVMTVTNRDLFFLTQDAYRDIKKRYSSELHNTFPALDYVLEPIGRNTAAAIACSALEIVALYGDDAIMLVLSADHLILKTEAFTASVQKAQALALQGQLVTFGITPTYPETGYGYIQADGSTVKRFVEKPDEGTAKQYLESGEYLWNAGIFCFKASTVVDELLTYAPELMEAVKQSLLLKHSRAIDRQQEIELDYATFSKIPNISIDYALMEHSKKVSVVACDIGWSDVGSWTAIGDLVAADDCGNRVDASNSIVHNTHNCYIRGDSQRLIATVGVENLIIVDTADAVLIANKDHAQDVKIIVDKLKSRQDDAYRLHRTVHRPWGTYTVLEDGDGYKMKRIVVKPGERLSLQMHHHRSEHWIVVSGVAMIVNGDNEILIHPNESAYIPAGQHHRLSNPGILDCIMIEVQVGQYLGEDDIVRFEDIYGRKPI